MNRIRQVLIAAVIFAVPLIGIASTQASMRDCPTWSTKRWACREAQSTARVPAAPNQRLVFSDDFDATGDLSLWDGRRELKQERGDVYSGNYAMRATSTGTPLTVQTKLQNTYHELFYRVRFKIVSQGPNSVYLLRVRSKTNDAIVGFFVSKTGGLGFRNDITGASFTSTTVVPIAEWNEIQVRVLVAGRGSQINVWFNGDQISSLSQTIWLGTSAIGRIELGESSGGRTFDVIFDDVAVDTVFIPSDRLPDPISGVLSVQTSPAIANVPFTLDGSTFYSDAQGVAQVAIARWSTDLRTRISVPETDVGDGRRVRLARWFRWSNSLDGRAVAALDVSVPVTWSFENLEGESVDPKLVSSVTLRSSTGITIDFASDATGVPQYLQMSREIATQDGLQTKNIYYTVDQVLVNGSNVVIKSKSKFFPDTTREVSIPLMFYSARFRSKDAFFGFSTGEQVKIVAPDGTITLIPIKDGEVFIPALARGEYHVSIGGPGFSPPRPIAVSRNQDVELKVFSYLDMAVSGLLIAGFAFGLLFVGRPKLLSPRYVLRWVWNEIQQQSRGVLAR